MQGKYRVIVALLQSNIYIYIHTYIVTHVDLAGVGREWRMRSRDRGKWRRVVETAVKRDQ